MRQTIKEQRTEANRHIARMCANSNARNHVSKLQVGLDVMKPENTMQECKQQTREQHRQANCNNARNQLSKKASS